MLEGKRPASFLELEQQPSVNPNDLVHVFEDYVETGAAISARAVMGIIRRTSLGLPHLGAIGEALMIGMEDQSRRGFPKDAAEYAKLGRYISMKMNRLIRSQQAQ